MSKGGYLPTLDGWRAVAIVMVLMNHDNIHHFAGFSNVWFHVNGGIGVELFFALSGILICTRLLAEERARGSISLRSFYIRRVFRIQPVALVYLGVLTLLMLTGVLDRGFGGVVFALLLVRNYLPMHPIPVDWYTGHFWSLAVEEHFYLLLPAILVTFRKYRLHFLLGLTTLVRVWAGFVHRFPRLQFGWDPVFHTDLAILGILIAATMAVLLADPRIFNLSKKWLKPVPILLLAMVICYASTVRFNSLTALAKNCILPILVISSTLHPTSLVGRILELRPIRFLGRISYSIYIWQSLFFVHNWLIPQPHSVLLTKIQESWMRYPVLAIVVLASYYLLEKPLIRIGHKLAKSADSGSDETRKSGRGTDVAKSNSALHRLVP